MKLFLGAQLPISDGMNLWVGEGGRGFSHNGWLAAVTVCCSNVSHHFLHCLGKFFGCSWPKVKYVAFQVSAPALEVSLGFEIRDWFISIFLASVLLGIVGLPPVTVSQDLLFITLRWAGWFLFDHYPIFPIYFLFLF